MKNDYLIFVCILLYGISNFLNRLSVEHMSPLLIPSIVMVVYMFYAGATHYFIPSRFVWTWQSVGLTALAAVLSITASVLLFTILKGNKNSGSLVSLTTLHPIITLLLCSIILHEKISVYTYMGIILMIIGVILITYQASLKF